MTGPAAGIYSLGRARHRSQEKPYLLRDEIGGLVFGLLVWFISLAGDSRLTLKGYRGARFSYA